MKGNKMKSNWPKKLSLLGVLATSIPLVSLKAAQVKEKKEKSRLHISAEVEEKKSFTGWKVLNEEEREKEYISMLFTPLLGGFEYLTEGERAVVREAFKEAEKKARGRGHIWFWLRGEKAELEQEAEDKKAFESALSPYLTEGDRKKAYEAFNEKRWGNPRRKSWWDRKSDVDLEKVNSLFHFEDVVEENPLSEKEKSELWDLLEGFFHDSYLYLTAEERGKVWEIMKAAMHEGLERSKPFVLEEGSD